MSEILYKKVTRAGAITLPAKVRKELDFMQGQAVEVHVTEDNKIVIQRYQTRCFACKSTENVIEVDGSSLCMSCIGKFDKSAEGA